MGDTSHGQRRSAGSGFLEAEGDALEGLRAVARLKAGLSTSGNANQGSEIDGRICERYVLPQPARDKCWSLLNQTQTHLHSVRPSP